MAWKTDEMDGLGHSILVELMNLPVTFNDADEFQSKGSTKGRNLHVSIVELRKFLPIKRMDNGGSLSSPLMLLPVKSKALELNRPCGGHDRNNSTVSFVQGRADIAALVLLPPLPLLLPIDMPTPGSTLVKATISRFDSMPVPVVLLTAPIPFDEGVKNCGTLELRADPLVLTTRG